MKGTTLPKIELAVSTHSKGRGGETPRAIVVHHMAGNLTLAQCQKTFQNRHSSATYAIDTKGNIGQFVDEADRPWTTSGADPDNHAITIELANDQIGGQWHITDATIKAAVGLCADICERYNIKRLYYNGKAGTLLRHCDYAPTACPGPYFKSITTDFCKWVNEKLAEDRDTEHLYHVQTGAFRNKENAERLAEKMRSEGYQTVIKEDK